tara:strand:+ start:16 stop:1650 length:1635 start_codon:yes stop_codon:yes gene_type:complete
MAEQKVKFKKPSVNFEAILQKQRAMEDDEKFAISDSLQKFIDESSKQAGYQNQDKLDDAGIRQEVINFVENYTISNLDGLKGADYDEALQTQKSTDKQIEEIFKLKEDQGGLNDAEKQYIKDTVQATNKKLGEILGLSTRLKLAFRDFKKELKPLKLAARVGLTNIPIIGKRIERAIRAEEEGEAEALRIKRGLRKREARGARKAGDLDVAETQTESETQQTKTQAKQATAQLLGTDNRTDLFADKEQRVEEERESDTQFETTSNILERILEESELTNELLGGKGKKGVLAGDGDDKGGFSILEVLGLKKLADFAKAGGVTRLITSLKSLTKAAGIFGVAAGLGIGLGKLIEMIGMRNVEEEERKVINEQSRDITSSANNEGVLNEDLEAESNARLEGINKDEYKKLRNRGDLDEDITLEQYSRAKKEARVGNKITSYFTGKIKEGKLEKIMAVLAGPTTTVEGSVTTNTDTSSITNNTTQKMDNVATMNESGMNKSVNETTSTTNNVVNNNVQQNDNSQNTNKTEYGSSSIGTKNNAGFSDFY